MVPTRRSLARPAVPCAVTAWQLHGSHPLTSWARLIERYPHFKLVTEDSGVPVGMCNTAVDLRAASCGLPRGHRRRTRPYRATFPTLRSPTYSRPSAMAEGGMVPADRVIPAVAALTH